MQKEGKLGPAKIAAVVRETAPCPTAKTDEELGVNVLRTKYFDNQPVYVDKKAQMIKVMGQKVSMGNLFAMVWNLRSYMARVNKNKIEANKSFKHGDSTHKGGVLVVGRGGKNAAFQLEIVGEPIDTEKLLVAVKAALA